MKTIGIYPGSFQPATKAHLNVYKMLKKKCGTDTFVVTTDKTPTPDAPLNFGDKEQIWVRHGVPGSHIVKLSDWKNPTEIFNNFSEQHTAAIFALNNNDINKLSIIKNVSTENIKNKEVWSNTDGQISYFQPYKGNEGSMKPLSQHGYIMEIDDTRLDGKPVTTLNIRQALGSIKYNDEQKKKFFRHIFGWFDIGLYSLIVSKFRQAYQASSETDTQTEMNENTKLKLQNMVREILLELIDEDYGSLNPNLVSGNNSNSTTDMQTSVDSATQNPTQVAANAAKQKAALVTSKKELEAKAKQNKQQRDNYSTTVKNYDTFQKKTDREAIDSVNALLSQPSTSTT